MKWILIGTLLGSLVTSTHETREACEGRAVLLREKGVIAKCVETPPQASWSTTGSITLTPGTTLCSYNGQSLQGCN
jgi:hypothetical protein